MTWRGASPAQSGLLSQNKHNRWLEMDAPSRARARVCVGRWRREWGGGESELGQVCSDGRKRSALRGAEGRSRYRSRRRDAEGRGHLWEVEWAWKWGSRDCWLLTQQALR